MREIKFRAWCKSEKKMCPVDVLTGNGAFLIGIEPGNGRFIEFEDLELMQYAGLKDKNDDDIYEGDIVDYRGEIYGYPYNDGKYEVIFNRGGFILISNEDEISSFGIDFNLNTMRIIGNIHENPELLNDK